MRPLIKQLKGDFAMKLSTNMILQALATIAQILNLMLDILPTKYKPIAAVVIGCIQVIVSNYAHKVNPDGTPATQAYAPPPKTPSLFPLILCALLLSASSASAQEKIGAAGIGYFQSGHPQFQGGAALGFSIAPRTISFTDMVIGATKDEGRITVAGQRLQYSFRTGFAVKIYQITPSWTLWGLSDIGLAADGKSIGRSFQYGGFLDKSVGKGWGFLMILSAENTVQTGTDFSPRIYIRKKL
jgi:hypothetical protein